MSRFVTRVTMASGTTPAVRNLSYSGKSGSATSVVPLWMKALAHWLSVIRTSRDVPGESPLTLGGDSRGNQKIVIKPVLLRNERVTSAVDDVRTNSCAVVGSLRDNTLNINRPDPSGECGHSSDEQVSIPSRTTVPTCEGYEPDNDQVIDKTDAAVFNSRYTAGGKSNQGEEVYVLKGMQAAVHVEMPPTDTSSRQEAQSEIVGSTTSSSSSSCPSGCPSGTNGLNTNMKGMQVFLGGNCSSVDDDLAILEVDQAGASPLASSGSVSSCSFDLIR